MPRQSGTCPPTRPQATATCSSYSSRRGGSTRRVAVGHFRKRRERPECTATPLRGEIKPVKSPSVPDVTLSELRKEVTARKTRDSPSKRHRRRFSRERQFRVPRACVPDDATAVDRLVRRERDGDRALSCRPRSHSRFGSRARTPNTRSARDSGYRQSPARRCRPIGPTKR